MPHFIDLTGKQFKRLTVLERVKSNKRNEACWKCLCKCGNIAIVSGHELRNEHTGSCGCFRKEFAFKKTFIHGFSKTPEYNTWIKMIERCYNPKDKAFKFYGKRGITVCKSWRNDFMSFFNDMGKRPADMDSIDRRDNNLGYFKENCRWSTIIEQANNKRNNVRITIHSWNMSPSEWAKFTGINLSTLYNRMHRGWLPTKAIFYPVRHRTP